MQCEGREEKGDTRGEKWDREREERE